MKVLPTQPTITQHQFDAVFEVLSQGYRVIRAASRDGDMTNCEDLSNAWFGLPSLLAKGVNPGSAIKAYVAVFCKCMRIEYPEVNRWSPSKVR